MFLSPSFPLTFQTTNVIAHSFVLGTILGSGRIWQQTRDEFPVLRGTGPRTWEWGTDNKQQTGKWRVSGSEPGGQGGVARDKLADDGTCELSHEDKRQP